jgi:hypothetical protein
MDWADKRNVIEKGILWIIKDKPKMAVRATAEVGPY